MKKISGIILKTVVSLFFIYLVTRAIDFSKTFEILKNVDLTFLFFILILNYIVTFFIGLRWYYILQMFNEKLSFLGVWKLSLIGLCFNIILPTGTGGDAVKILYITKNQKEKLKAATSVVFDRFIGSSTIVLMAIISLLSYEKNLPVKLKIVLSSLLILVLLIWLVILWEKLAIFIARIFPYKIRQKLKAFYNHLRFYSINTKMLTKAVLASFAVQILSVYIQYLCAMLVSPTGNSPVPFFLFFVFIPIIWLSAIVPSLGGLGIREYGYLFFFKSYTGENAAIALAILNLFLIFSQAVLGGLIFLFFHLFRQENR